MKIDTDAIRELADLLNETGLTEIEVTDGDKVIRVGKNASVLSANIGAPVFSASGMPSDLSVPQAAGMDTPSNVASSHPGAVKSPMVGTVYMQSEPGVPPFVAKGSTVTAGDTLLIIEAMKVMNPIKAEKSGTVTQLLVENGEPIEFDDVLMVIE